MGRGLTNRNYAAACGGRRQEYPFLITRPPRAASFMRRLGGNLPLSVGAPDGRYHEAQKESPSQTVECYEGEDFPEEQHEGEPECAQRQAFESRG